MGNRRIGRETALQYLFSHELSGSHDGTDSLFALRMAKQQPTPKSNLEHDSNSLETSEQLDYEVPAKNQQYNIGSDAAHFAISNAGLPTLVKKLENALACAESKSTKRKITKQLKLVRDHSRNQEFVELLVHGVLNNQKRIDEQIEEKLQNFTLPRLATIDWNVLRIAVFEMFHCEETPPIVAINEAIEMAKRFGSEESGSFVNGILDRLKDELTRPLRN